MLGETHNNFKLDKGNEIGFCQEYKYLGVIFDTSGTDDKGIRLRVIQVVFLLPFFEHGHTM